MTSALDAGSRNFRVAPPKSGAGCATRPLGRTGLRISELGVGCGSLATGGTAAETMDMLQACWERGLRTFDTAPLYDQSEARLGSFLANHDRDDFIVSTKAGRLPASAGQRRFSFSRDDVARSIDESLTRLRIDYIDLLSVHDLAPVMLGNGFEQARRNLLDDTMKLLVDLRGSGVIRALGVASYDCESTLALVKDAPFESVMIVGGCTLLSQAADRELIPHCARAGIGVLAASPFHTGLLITGAVAGARFNFQEAAPALLDRVARIERVCRRHNVPLAAAALQFPLRHPAISGVVAGHRTPSEVAMNMAWLNATVPDDFWRDLADAGLLNPALPPTLPDGGI